MVFAKAIKILESEARTRREMIEDTTGVITPASKDGSRKDVDEIEEAIQFLKQESK